MIFFSTLIFQLLYEVIMQISANEINSPGRCKKEKYKTTSLSQFPGIALQNTKKSFIW